MFTELIQFVLNNTVLHLVINQTTRVSNGTVKMAILLEICKQRGTHLVIASQYGVSPMSISEADQLRIEHRNGKWTSFRATIAKLSNNASKLFQSFLLEARNEHCRLPATSLLQKSLIESDEMARQNRLIERAKKRAADEEQAAFNRAEQAKKQAATMAIKLEVENNFAERTAFMHAEEKERVAAAKEAAKQLAAMTNCTVDSKWVYMFECLERYIENTREMATRHMNDEQKAAWIWDGNVPQSYKTPCGKALGGWIHTQRTAKAKETLKDIREVRLTSTCLRWNMKQ
jgi:hypothetical protein